MTTRTQHTLPAKGRTATGLIGQANRQHAKGRGKRVPHRKGESDGENLAPNVQEWFKRNKEELPRFSKSKATKERPEEKPVNEKGQAALDNGGRTKTFDNGAKVILTAKGRIAQNLLGPNRTADGRFSKDPFTVEKARERNLALARRAIDAFFGKHDPSGPQLKGALLGLKRAVEAKGGYVPAIDAEDL